MKIGFIGAGVMGKHMIRNLTKAGFIVNVYARNINKVQDLISEGYIFKDSIKELVADVDVVITIVGYPSDVEEVYLDIDKILTNLSSEKIVIDMTTSSPTLAKKIYHIAKEKKIYSLDAPVTGGDLGAIKGELTIFVGGDYVIYEKCLPIFKAMGKVIQYVGESGCGQHAKLANQIAIAGAISGMCETITYAINNNIDPKLLVNVWGSGSAGSWQMINMAPRALNHDYAPGFFIKHFIKDMNLAINESKSKNLNLKMLHTVRDMFQELSDRGYSEMGTQAIIDYYKKEEKK
ncbi:MAG TPA: NAD(P)-dependent oxidoreductase [Acholeplasmataceae bacterium]|nr:NAD(P)-dependent oxidoreductase [Acholeplasmataceae bacterium]